MNPIQLTIIAVVVILILATIAYYWYQEAKFKRMVENMFNQKTDDILMEANKTLVFEGENKNSGVATGTPILQKDVSKESSMDKSDAIDPLFGNLYDEDNISPLRGLFNRNKLTKDNNEETKPVAAQVEQVPNLSSKMNIITDTESIPADSAEAFFVKLDKLDFPFATEIVTGLDFVVDIVFEETKKLKILPEITQFTHKPFVFYVLDKDNCWHVFEKGKKYMAAALKLAVELVDKDGIISQAQVSNIYNELHRFVLSNQAHIRASNYELDIDQIRQDINRLSGIELNLELYLIARDSFDYTHLTQFLKTDGFTEVSGIFSYVVAHRDLFTIANENGSALERGKNCKLLKITAKLHLYEDLLAVVDAIFDFTERFVEHFESRVLTANKLVLEQKDYDALVKYIKDYTADAKKNNIKLGGELIRRIY